MTPITTRVAPSPTGMFHMGTARTALFNYLTAKASGGRFILRIDDTDQSRNTKEAEDVIFSALDWLGLVPDAVYRQSERLDLYADTARRMVADGSASVIEKGAIALNRPDNLPHSWIDDLTGEIKVTPHDVKLISGLVLLRSDDKGPTYNFASIVDDVDLGIDLVLRGVDHIANTPKQLGIIYGGKLTPTPPRFAHLGLIMIKADGVRKKLSKRDDAASLLHFRDDGVTPSAMIQFLLRMGWSPTDSKFDQHTKVITLNDAIDLFLTSGGMRNSPALFDEDRLRSLNRVHSRISAS